MAQTIISKQLIRRGNLADMPFLSAGEFGLAQDEQRLYLGQSPIVGGVVSSGANTAVLEFSVAVNSVVTKVDLDYAANSTYKIVVMDSVNGTEADIPGHSISISNGQMTIAHGLGREVDPADTFTLHYNKEITSYVDDDGSTSQRQAEILHKTQPVNNPESTGYIAHSAVKNSIQLDYTLFFAGTADVRQGTLTITINGDNVSTIKDEYSSNNTALDIEFSIDASNGIFTLMYDTTYTNQIQFNYLEKSYQNLVA